MSSVDLAETGVVPDWLIRLGIRRMLRDRLRQLSPRNCEAAEASHLEFLEQTRRSPIALVPELANDQHYEVAPRFFETVLGGRLKYSCGWWPVGVRDLDTAEARMLDLTCRRAQIRDGMTILDLGCGWGSLGLWIAEHYAECRVLALSNSKLQRDFILGRCERRDLSNLEVLTADINVFDTERRFDRVVSIEMFEHLRNHEAILSRIARWLAPDGKLFVHIFCHREYAYPYDSEGDGNWMGRHFFTGGMMPSDRLLLHHQRDLVLDRKWRVSGLHYHQTCEAWLANLDERRAEVLPVLAEVYGPAKAELWLQRWRLFFLSCSELFRFRRGDEWFVSHYRFRRREERLG
jgi:cyclopropane-fatty-acyl-phospholipid synthase